MMKSRKLFVESLMARLPFAVDVLEAEPNNTPAQATSFNWPADESVALKGTSQSKDDKDFFTFTAPSTGKITLSVQSAGGASLEVESRGVNIFETEPKDGVNSGSFPVQAGQSYFVRLRAPDKSPASYVANLALGGTGGSTGGTGGSTGGTTGGTGGSTGGSSSSVTESEPNDKVGSANKANLAVGTPIELSGSASKKDRDFFLITPAASGTVTLDTGNSGIKISVETQQGTKLFETEPNDGIIRGTFSTNGSPFVLRARGDSSAVTAYKVSLSLGSQAAAQTTTSNITATRTVPTGWLDTSDDGQVSPLDALLLVEHLSRSARGGVSDDSASVRFDMNDDSEVSPVDALLVIDHLSRRGRSKDDAAGEDARVDAAFASAFPVDFDINRKSLGRPLFGE